MPSTEVPMAATPIYLFPRPPLRMAGLNALTCINTLRQLWSAWILVATIQGRRSKADLPLVLMKSRTLPCMAGVGLEYTTCLCSLVSHQPDITGRKTTAFRSGLPSAHPARPATPAQVQSLFALTMSSHICSAASLEAT